jgi:hypothetical protein
MPRLTLGSSWQPNVKQQVVHSELPSQLKPCFTCRAGWNNDVFFLSTACRWHELLADDDLLPDEHLPESGGAATILNADLGSDDDLDDKDFGADGSDADVNGDADESGPSGTRPEPTGVTTLLQRSKRALARIPCTRQICCPTGSEHRIIQQDQEHRRAHRQLTCKLRSRLCYHFSCRTMKSGVFHACL